MTKSELESLVREELGVDWSDILFYMDTIYVTTSSFSFTGLMNLERHEIVSCTYIAVDQDASDVMFKLEINLNDLPNN